MDKALTTVVTLIDLMNMLAMKRGAKMVSLTTYTDADVYLTGNPYGKIKKRAHYTATLSFDYEAAVNRQRDREEKPADFKAGAAVWGWQPVPESPFVYYASQKTGKRSLYLYAKAEKPLSVEYFTPDGQPLTLDQVKPFLKPEKESGQGLDREVKPRIVTVDNIERIAALGSAMMIDPASITPAVEWVESNIFATA